MANGAIFVKDIIESPFGITFEDGEAVYNDLVTEIKNRNKVNLSFEEISEVPFVFLGATIGALYESFPEEDINPFLKITGLNQDDRELMECIKDTSVYYFHNKDHVDQILGDLREGRD